MASVVVLTILYSSPICSQVTLRRTEDPDPLTSSSSISRIISREANSSEQVPYYMQLSWNLSTNYELEIINGQTLDWRVDVGVRPVKYIPPAALQPSYELVVDVGKHTGYITELWSYEENEGLAIMAFLPVFPGADKSRRYLYYIQCLARMPIDRSTVESTDCDSGSDRKTNELNTMENLEPDSVRNLMIDISRNWFNSSEQVLEQLTAEETDIWSVGEVTIGIQFLTLTLPNTRRMVSIHMNSGRSEFVTDDHMFVT